jgi:hypothetical protein
MKAGNNGSLVLGRVFRGTRRAVQAGGFSAMSLGDLQGAKRKVAKQVCKRHVWLRGKWFWECRRCGLVEEV